MTPAATELVGAAIGLQLSPQQLADALGIRVQRKQLSPALWAVWIPGKNALLLSTPCTGIRRDYALVIAAAHRLTRQLRETEEAYLFGKNFHPYSEGERSAQVMTVVESYFRTRPPGQVLARVPDPR